MYNNKYCALEIQQISVVLIKPFISITRMHHATVTQPSNHENHTKISSGSLSQGSHNKFKIFPQYSNETVRIFADQTAISSKRQPFPISQFSKHFPIRLYPTVFHGRVRSKFLHVPQHNFFYRFSGWRRLFFVSIFLTIAAIENGKMCAFIRPRSNGISVNLCWFVQQKQ